ncbi:MAG: ABC transporter permease [Candidatus Methylomirabilales bacterium]
MRTVAEAGRKVQAGKPAAVLAQIREVVAYRELLISLIRRELKVRYKNSALGFVWSMLNPLLYLAIFSIVLGVFLRAGLPWFPFYLLSGLLAWNLLAASLTASAGSIVGNASLVTKVYFPREILPLSAIGAAFYNFLLQLVVLVSAMALFGYQRFWDAGILILPLALLVQILFIIGLAFLVASLNVYFRDVQYLLELVLLAWFWMTPIVYASAWVADRLQRFDLLYSAYFANPMNIIVIGYQRALYSQVSPPTREGAVSVLIDQPLSWYVTRLGLAGLASIVLITFGWRVFRRLHSRFAEEL